MELYFVRHGKTEWNKEMRLQGRFGDSPLLKTSYQQIELLGQVLTPVDFEVCFCSPSRRARETAEGILTCQKAPVPIHFEENFRELGYGDLEGQKISTSKARYPKALHAMRHDPSQYHPEAFHGESYVKMLERMSSVVEQAMIDYPTGPILFVGHGASLTGCIQHLLGKPLDRLREDGGLANNSLTILDYSKGQFKMKQWNDTSFLA